MRGVGEASRDELFQSCLRRVAEVGEEREEGNTAPRVVAQER